MATMQVLGVAGPFTVHTLETHAGSASLRCQAHLVAYERRSDGRFEGVAAFLPAGIDLEGLALEPAHLILIEVPDFFLQSIGLRIPGLRGHPLQAVQIADPVVCHAAELIAAVARRQNAALHLPMPVERIMASVLEHLLAPNGGNTATSLRPPALDAERLRRVLEYVEPRLGGPISLAGMSAAAAFSAYHFARRFRQATGTSPMRWVMQQRIRRSQDLLLQERGMTVAAVAYACGFGSQAQFSRQFRARTGTTPIEYRRSGGQLPHSTQLSG